MFRDLNEAKLLHPRTGAPRHDLVRPTATGNFGVLFPKDELSSSRFAETLAGPRTRTKLRCGFERGRQGVNKGGIPVDGDFIDARVALFVLPIARLGIGAANQISRPGVMPVRAAPVVRMLRRIESEAGDERAAKVIAAKEEVQRVLTRGAVLRFVREPVRRRPQKLGQ